jgi:hypothetical protein
MFNFGPEGPTMLQRTFRLMASEQENQENIEKSLGPPQTAEEALTLLGVDLRILERVGGSNVPGNKAGHNSQLP